MKKLNILVAEDDEQNHALLKLILEREGHRVKGVWNGVEAVKAVKSGRFDLVFMDIQMPELDGLDATKQIRQWEANKSYTPIVILTASLMERNIDQYKNTGADALIQKPFNVARITALLNIISSDKEDITTNESQKEPDNLPSELPILDVKEAISRFNNESKLYGENLSELIQSLPGRMDKMRNALNKKSWYELSIFAHNLKGVSANIGARQMSSLASNLEIASLNEEILSAEKALTEMVNNSEKLVNAAMQIIASENSQNSDS